MKKIDANGSNKKMTMDKSKVWEKSMTPYISLSPCIKKNKTNNSQLKLAAMTPTRHQYSQRARKFKS